MRENERLLSLYSSQKGRVTRARVLSTRAQKYNIHIPANHTSQTQNICNHDCKLPQSLSTLYKSLEIRNRVIGINLLLPQNSVFEAPTHILDNPSSAARCITHAGTDTTHPNSSSTHYSPTTSSSNPHPHPQYNRQDAHNTWQHVIYFPPASPSFLATTEPRLPTQNFEV